ncbi:MAG: hypothetical protein CMC48_06520 [Flavobacteriaceae bacterium]|nr:hypothetical protein [Flavobacteriaceae bacterium]|tara:strand:+ start:1887 stop:2366 length:480 start_codon:yes stop_codon:yes gene_type:complete
MKNKILVYVVAFMSLILIFLSINYIKISNSNESNSKILNNKIDSLENRYKLLDKRFTDEIYFSLNDNQEALEHFNYINVDSLASYIRDELYEKNINQNANNFVPISNTNYKYLINKVKILNHKWIIADFSNGSSWGEMWIEYYFDKNKVVFDVKDFFIY